MGEQIVDRAHGVLQEWDKIDENEFLNRDSKNFAKYSKAVAGVFKGAAEYIDTQAPLTGKVLAEGLRATGDAFELMHTAAMAGAAWEATTKQGTTGAKGPIHQDTKETKAFDKFRHVSNQFKKQFNITVRQEWYDGNYVRDYLIIKAPNGDTEEIDKNKTQAFMRALSRLESIKGAPVTQQEAFELATGQLELRQFEVEEDLFAIDLETGRQKTTKVNISYLAGKLGEEQEYDAGRYYAKARLLGEAIVGVKAYKNEDGTYKDFESLNSWERMALIRRHNRLNKLYRLSGRKGDLPANTLGKLLIEEAELKNEGVKDFSITESLIVDGLQTRLDDPLVPSEEKEEIIALLQKERAHIGMSKLDDLQKTDQPSVERPPDVEQLTAETDGFGMLGSEDKEEDGKGTSGWGTSALSENVEAPVEKKPKGGSDEFAAPGSAQAHKAIEETEKARPRGKRFAENLNKFLSDIEREQAQRQAEANEFLKEGLDAFGKSVVAIGGSYIKRNNRQKPQTPALNLRPVGPNYNPADGWGKPGQVSTGAVKCPENQKERQNKCARVISYIRKYESLSKADKIWNVNIQRAYLFRAQCCGYRWTTNAPQQTKGNENKTAAPPAAPPPPPAAPQTYDDGQTQGNAGPAGGMSRTECIHKFCPECAEAISLMEVSADPDCEACKKRNAANIDQCVSGGSNSSTSQSVSGDTGDYGYNTTGLPNPKVYYVFKQYQPSQKNYHYTIGKINAGRHIIYGPDTFEGCRAWAIQKGHW